MKKWIYRILVIAWMIIIFTFSAKDATRSEEDSLRVGYALAHVFQADFEDWDAADQIAYVESYIFYIRKAAHMTEYAILGLLLVNAIGIRCQWKSRGLTSWVAGTLYACTDEFHQTFVPGRIGELRDVCIDSIGVLLGVLTTIGIICFIEKRKKRLAS